MFVVACMDIFLGRCKVFFYSFSHSFDETFKRFRCDRSIMESTFHVVGRLRNDDVFSFSRGFGGTFK